MDLHLCSLPMAIYMGAVLDRNGLRPSRYYITDDDYLILSSEVGVLDIEPEHDSDEGSFTSG